MSSRSDAVQSSR